MATMIVVIVSAFAGFILGGAIAYPLGRSDGEADVADYYRRRMRNEEGR